jgi:acyl carrier protein
MDENRIKDKIKEIAESIVDIDKNEFAAAERSLLYIILSNSQQAVNFVSLIEDEFDIEIDDEYINLDFFESFDKIYRIIYNYIK